MRSALAVFLTLAVLLGLIGQVNHALSPLHVFLFDGGLFVTYGALTLPFGPGLAAALAAGLLYDANTPVAMGTHALLFGAAHALLYRWRDHLPHDDATGQVTVALLANLGLFLSLAFILGHRAPTPVSNWPRIGADLIWSQIAVALAGPWCFALQRRVLSLPA